MLKQIKTGFSSEKNEMVHFYKRCGQGSPVQEMARGKTNLQDREKSGSFSLSKGKLIVTLLIYM